MKINKSFLYIALYYIIAISIRYIFIIVKPTFFTELHPYLQSLLTGVGPFIGGLVLIKIFNRKNDLSFFKIGRLKTIVIILFPIIAFTVAGYINTGLIQFSIVNITIVAIIYGILEEYGWRGYLQTELKDFKAIYKYLIISVLWYFWHLDFGLDFQHLLSYFYVLAGSFGIGYVANKSKSLVLPSLFHAFYNIVFTNTYEGILLSQRIIIIVLSAIVSIYFMRKYIKENKTALQKKISSK